MVQFYRGLGHASKTGVCLWSQLGTSGWQFPTKQKADDLICALNGEAPDLPLGSITVEFLVKGNQLVYRPA